MPGARVGGDAWVAPSSASGFQAPFAFDQALSFVASFLPALRAFWGSSCKLTSVGGEDRHG